MPKLWKCDGCGAIANEDNTDSWEWVELNRPDLNPEERYKTMAFCHQCSPVGIITQGDLDA